MNNFFKVLHKSSHLHQGYGGQAKSKARLGEIDSDHGNMKTPGFISAATKGTIKTLTPQQIKDIGIQGACVNTYHLVTHPGTDVIERAGGIQKYSGLNIFTMSDSGGFQVFSLAREQRKANVRGEEQPLVVKISEDGVKFRSSFDGELIEFTPERSMEFQRQIGADINMAFDECTYYPSTHKYAEKAMERTHRWLKRCIKYVGAQFIAPKNKGLINQTPTRKQYLYGVIQGGTFEDLRKKSAEFVVSQNTPGVAIGGVSVGETKKEMREQV
ncbi:MAG: queuine tRNA-ribosyltransferase family protein, partial [Candidatus Roizmanbacteria bacterium]|nr:queuine tRNA-ribosyltransferase family protein [Candidatus Roizmanbacteria bacterium]